jgi:RNA polymerase-binding protein DksA
MNRATISRERREQLKQKLLDRQRALFRDVEGVAADLSTIEESQDIEFEGRAQVEAMARLLERIGEHDRRELQEIHAALGRLAEGSYGICERCGDAIAPERLEAVPATRWCVECAADEERLRSQGAPGFEPRSHRVVPAEYRDLDDAELAEAVRERLRLHDDPDLAKVAVRCHRGRVRLSGVLPSEGQRQVLLRIVEDEMGLETIDRLRISPPRSRAPRGRGAARTGRGTSCGGEDPCRPGDAASGARALASPGGRSRDAGLRSGQPGSGRGMTGRPQLRRPTRVKAGL